MKSIEPETFNNEMKEAETEGEIKKTNGLNWAYISFGFIILTLLVAILALRFVPLDSLPKLNEETNTSGNPKDGK